MGKKSILLIVCLQVLFYLPLSGQWAKSWGGEMGWYIDPNIYPLGDSGYIIAGVTDNLGFENIPSRYPHNFILAVKLTPADDYYACRYSSLPGISVSSSSLRRMSLDFTLEDFSLSLVDYWQQVTEGTKDTVDLCVWGEEDPTSKNEKNKKSKIKR